ncbi:MAG: glycosyltransferase family 10 [Leptolyngbyaceae bacterium]|nr:glycosyltransferase family 10 [Leptolyngbyaceae bacterium]
MVNSPKYTIGMVSSYTGLNPRPVDWLWNQTPHALGQWGNIQLNARSPHPDVLLLYQYNFDSPVFSPPDSNRSSHLTRSNLWPFRHRSSSKAPTPEQPAIDAVLQQVPKERILSLTREPPLDEIIEKQNHHYQTAQNHCGFVAGPADFAPTPDYMPAIWYVKASFRELDTLDAPPKARMCSWITSGISRTENHRKRLAFMQQLVENSVDVDLFGRDLPDWAKGGGEVSNKWHVMAPYYYNLAIENYADNAWYASEKLWDSLLAWCLPIYYGGSAADTLLPEGSFVRLPSLDEAGLAYIRDITSTPDAWHERKGAIAEARQIILHKLNLMNWLSEYVNQWG